MASRGYALDQIRALSGRQFDPRLVQAFERLDLDEATRSCYRLKALSEAV